MYQGMTLVVPKKPQKENCARPSECEGARSEAKRAKK